MSTQYLDNSERFLLLCSLPFPLGLCGSRVESSVANPHVSLHETLEVMSFEEFLDRVPEIEVTADLVIRRHSILLRFQKLDCILDQDQSLGLPLHIEPRQVEQRALQTE